MNEPNNPCPSDTVRLAPYIVLYDPKCKFCLGSIATLRRLDNDQRTKPMPVSSAPVSNMPELSNAEVRRRLHIICPSGEIKSGFAAVIELAGLFPATRLLARVAAYTPFFAVGSALYEWVANHRYLFGTCENDHCGLGS
jgi:predicted DCC family thiol-disulfide oxidoreductase YuxK